MAYKRGVYKKKALKVGDAELDRVTKKLRIIGNECCYIAHAVPIYEYI